MKNKFLTVASIAPVLLLCTTLVRAQEAPPSPARPGVAEAPAAPAKPASPTKLSAPAASTSAPSLSGPTATLTVSEGSTSVLDKPSQDPSELKIFSLKYADAASLGQLLRQVSDCVVAPDVRSNQIVVSGSKKGIELAETIIKGLDVPAENPPTTTPVTHGVITFPAAQAANSGSGGGVSVSTGAVGVPQGGPGTIVLQGRNPPGKVGQAVPVVLRTTNKHSNFIESSCKLRMRRSSKPMRRQNNLPRCSSGFKK